MKSASSRNGKASLNGLCRICLNKIDRESAQSSCGTSARNLSAILPALVRHGTGSNSNFNSVYTLWAITHTLDCCSSYCTKLANTKLLMNSLKSAIAGISK